MNVREDSQWRKVGRKGEERTMRGKKGGWGGRIDLGLLDYM